MESLKCNENDPSTGIDKNITWRIKWSSVVHVVKSIEDVLGAEPKQWIGTMGGGRDKHMGIISRNCNYLLY